MESQEGFSPLTALTNDWAFGLSLAKFSVSLAVCSADLA
ncbi:hypothetical protein SVIOM342S_08494 [Streptomyces violaceorubidus]